VAIKSDAAIYALIERYLKASKTPLTSVDLWDRSDIRKAEKSAEKVSDRLGLLWRRGLVQRWEIRRPDTRARFGYTWKDEAAKADSTPRMLEAVGVAGYPRRKANVAIIERDDCIVLEFDKFTITVQAKG
jgi:hypothetical protein